MVVFNTSLPWREGRFAWFEGYAVRFVPDSLMKVPGLLDGKLSQLDFCWVGGGLIGKDLTPESLFLFEF